jgi:hypothetical protein
MQHTELRQTTGSGTRDVTINNLGRSRRYRKMRLTSRLYLKYMVRLVMVPAPVALPPTHATIESLFTAVKLR